MNQFSKVVELLDTAPDLLGTERTERRDAVENRARILAAAHSLFAQRSVACVSMAEIAIEAGVGKGTLYRRFANKGELCLALLDGHLQTFQDAMLAEMHTMRSQRISYCQQLCSVLRSIVHFTETHTALLREVQHNGVMGGSETTSPHFVWQYLTVRGLLQAAVRAGELRPTVDVEWVADALLAPLNAQFYQFLRETRGFSQERIAEGLWNLVENLPVPQAGKK